MSRQDLLDVRLGAEPAADVDSPQVVEVPENFLLSGDDGAQLLTGGAGLKDEYKGRGLTGAAQGTRPSHVTGFAHLPGLDARPLLADLVRDDGHVPPLLVQDHGELTVELFDLHVDAVLALEHLTDLSVVHALVQVFDLKEEQKKRD